jgi:hypothetical protein
MEHMQPDKTAWDHVLGNQGGFRRSTASTAREQDKRGEQRRADTGGGFGQTTQKRYCCTAFVTQPHEWSHVSLFGGSVGIVSPHGEFILATEVCVPASTALHPVGVADAGQDRNIPPNITRRSRSVTGGNGKDKGPTSQGLRPP